MGCKQTLNRPQWEDLIRGKLLARLKLPRRTAQNRVFGSNQYIFLITHFCFFRNNGNNRRRLALHSFSAWGARLGLTVRKWMLKAGALLLRTETEWVLKSRKASPTRMLEGRGGFRYPTWDLATPDLCAQWRATRGRRSAQPA